VTPGAEVGGRGAFRRGATTAAGLVFFWTTAAAQQDPPTDAPASAPSVASRPVDLERLVERANHANPYLSAQAAKALEKQGAAALPALEAFVARRSIYALSAPVVTWLGTLDDDRARATLRRAAFDREFPWRPYAVRALAVHPAAEDRGAFLRLLADKLPQVREAAAAGLGAAGAPSDPAAEVLERDALRAALGDASFDVQAAAAEALKKRGDASGLPAMLDALTLSRRFFDLDFGEIARRRAWAFVAPFAKGVVFDPGAPAAEREPALAKVRAALGGDAPASRPIAEDAGDVVFGLEVRSCRRGDAFIRLTAAGEIVVGQYDLRRIRLKPAALEALRTELVTAQRTAPAPLYGRPGCDFERYYLPDEEGLKRITVGPEGRPPEMRRLSALLREAIRDGLGPEAAAEHVERVAPYAAPEEEDGEGG
jgi:hypothetical protein